MPPRAMRAAPASVGVVLVTSGPGATNAVTGLVDALMDSIPVVCLTGQVPTHLIGNDAFQEADTTGITRPATKHNYLVKRGEDLARMVHEAFYVARSGRPGPVVIDLPKDIVIGKAPYIAAARGAAQELSPGHRARARAHRGGGRAAQGREAADHLHRRRRHQFRPGSGRPAHRVRAPDRLPLHQHADGARRLSGERPAIPRHARHARHLRGESRHAWRRRHARDRRPLRRPRDRAAQRVQPEQRARSTPISTARASTRTCRWTCRCSAMPAAILARADRGLEARCARRRTAPRSPNGGARSTSWRATDCLRLRAGHRAGRDHQAAARDPAALRDHARARARDLHHHRGRPAPDVGRAAFQVREAQSLDDLGRARHDGLRAAGRDGHAGRASRTRW